MTSNSTGLLPFVAPVVDGVGRFENCTAGGEDRAAPGGTVVDQLATDDDRRGPGVRVPARGGAQRQRDAHHPHVGRPLNRLGEGDLAKRQLLARERGLLRA